MDIEEDIFEIITIKTWQELADNLSGLDSTWIFRGQEKSTWHLTTSLEREPFDNYGGAEANMIRQLMRNINNYESPISQPQNNLEALAYLQHFGAPTRLLDFSHSSYIASFFAFENATEVDASLYAINYHNILNKSQRIIIQNHSEKFPPELLEDIKRRFDLTVTETFDAVFFSTRTNKFYWFSSSVCSK